MKKQYINPETITIKIETQAHMLFGSPDGENLNGGGNKGNYSGSGQLSRQGGGWDDED